MKKANNSGKENFLLVFLFVFGAMGLFYAFSSSKKEAVVNAQNNTNIELSVEASQEATVSAWQ